MSKLVKALAVLVALFVVVFGGLAIFIGTLNADKYRPELVQAIVKQTGREAKLDGPISFSLRLSGVHVAIQDASIANAAWGSRPLMAKMGKFELTVGILPLLAHQLSVNNLSIENADIYLETNAAGQHNWEFAAVGASGKAAPKVEATDASSPSVATGDSLSIEKLSIINSQLSMRSADGSVSSFNVASLDLTMGGSGAVLKFSGDANGAPITLNVKTGIKDLLSRDAFPFDAAVTYGVFHLTATGKVDANASKADVSTYELTAGKTTIKGNVSATWNDVRPAIQGTLNSDRINPADFKSDETPASQSDAPVNTNEKKTESTASKRVFSDAPLPLDALKKVDANLDVAVGDMPLGKDELKAISAKLALHAGGLVISPVKASVGDSPVNLQVTLETAQSPAKLNIAIVGDAVDLGDLQKLGGMTPFMSGKASANIQLAGQGNSMHQMASSLVGVIVVTAEKGEILKGAASNVSSLLANVFNPGGGNDAINCLAARFIAKNGVLADNGILIDSTASVVSGAGKVNLDSETVDMVLHAKTKLVDVGGLVPALQISGGMTDPHYSVDAVGVVKNVVGSLINGNLDVVASGVPDMQADPAGHNACIYTLDHPKAATSSTGVLSTNPVGQATDKVKNIGNSVLKGLFGQ